nr:MAG TPA: hypothetical protein [Bacteriophage sp.]
MCIKKECRWIKSSQALRKTFKKIITHERGFEHGRREKR